MARPMKQINKDEFEDLLNFQCTKEDIAGFFHVSEKTLQNYCRKTYKMTFSEIAEEYKAAGRVSIRRAQFAAAKAGNVQMLIHLGKHMLGQTDKVETSISGKISANVKHGNISKVIIYDPATGNPLEERINGEDDDVESYLKDRENYNGDVMTFNLPKKDPIPEDEITGEKEIVSQDGSVKAHVPWNGREELPDFVLRCGKTEISFPDDGRGGYGFEIPDIVMKSRNAVLEDYDDGRGGYGHEIPDRSVMTKEEYRKTINRSQPALRKGAVINE